MAENRLAGKVALISGAARGQGAMEARLFVAEGAKVMLGDILDEEGRKVADELNRGSETRRAEYVHLDVTKAADWDNAVATAERAFGGLDSFSAPSGVLTPTDAQSPILSSNLSLLWRHRMRGCGK